MWYYPPFGHANLQQDDRDGRIGHTPQLAAKPMKIAKLDKNVLEQIDTPSLKQSEHFIRGKCRSLAAYEDVEELGFALAEDQPIELRGVDYHFSRVRNALLKAFVSNRIFVGGTLLEELIFRAAKDPRTQDLFRSVVNQVFAIGIHGPGAVVVPIHSFGIAGFGFYRHYFKASVSIEFPEIGVAVSPQTNSINSTLSFLDSAARTLKLGQRVPHDSIRHYERSRPTAWLVRNPLLVLRIRGASGSHYENQRFLTTRIQIATSLIFMTAALTADYAGGAKNWFGSTSGISNLETLDIKHYVLLETGGRRGRKLRGLCVPIHIDAALLAELSELNIDLNLKALRIRRKSVASVVSVLAELEENYFRFLFEHKSKSMKVIVYRKIFDSLAYFRRSFRSAANPGEPIVNLAIAFEVLLTDNYAQGVKDRVVRRVRLALHGIRRNAAMRAEVTRLFEARGQVVHLGENSIQPNLQLARMAYVHSVIRVAQLAARKPGANATAQAIGEVLGDI
jgi:hypothetical protein